MDECNEKPGTCTQFCENQPGSYTCKCGEGYEKAPDGQTCKKKDGQCGSVMVSVVVVVV